MGPHSSTYRRRGHRRGEEGTDGAAWEGLAAAAVEVAKLVLENWCLLRAQELPWQRIRILDGDPCPEPETLQERASSSHHPPLLTFNTLHLKNGKRMTTVSSSATTTTTAAAASLSTTRAATAAAP